MRLLIHQAWKDILLLRWILLAWVLLTVALHVVVLFGVQHAASRTDVVLPATYMALLAISIAGFFVIPVLVVQTDPGVGTTAFWFTRPVSRFVVVAGKFLVIVPAVVLLPVVVDFLTLVAAGVPVGIAVRPFLGALGLQALWTLPLMAVAAFTTTLAQFVLVAIVDLLAFMGTLALVRGLFDVRVPSNADTVVAVSIAALLILAAVVLVTAYWWRDQRRSGVVAVAGPVCVVMLTLVWPWNIHLGPSGRPLPATVRIDPSSIRLERHRAYCTLVGYVDFTNVPADFELGISSSTLILRYDSKTIKAGASLSRLQKGESEAGGVIDAFGNNGRLGNGRARLTIGPAGCDAIAGRPVTLDVGLRFVGSSRREIAALPLSAGERFVFSEGAGEIAAVKRDPKLLGMTVAMRRLGRFADGGQDRARLEFMLRNARIGQTLTPANPNQRVGQSSFFTGTIPVPQNLESFFSTQDFGGAGNPAFDPSAWLRDGRLVIVETRPEGFFEKTITLSNIVLPVR